MTATITRRRLLKTGLSASALALLPRSAGAADNLVVATFPGTWNEAHRDVLAPYFRKKSNAEVTQTILPARAPAHRRTPEGPNIFEDDLIIAQTKLSALQVQFLRSSHSSCQAIWMASSLDSLDLPGSPEKPGSSVIHLCKSVKRTV